jgi:hypothetical protein
MIPTIEQTREMLFDALERGKQKAIADTEARMERQYQRLMRYLAEECKRLRSESNNKRDYK